MAILDLVTVSMGLDTMGVFKWIFLLKRLDRFTSYAEVWVRMVRWNCRGTAGIMK